MIGDAVFIYFLLGWLGYGYCVTTPYGNIGIYRCPDATDPYRNLPQPNELTDWITYVAGSSTSHMPGSNFLHLIVFIVGTRFQDLARERSRSDSFLGESTTPQI